MTIKTCSCGHDRSHSMVERIELYSGWNKIWIYTGISVKPYRIEYKCRTCGEVFDATEDVAELDRYVV